MLLGGIRLGRLVNITDTRKKHEFDPALYPGSGPERCMEMAWHAIREFENAEGYERDKVGW